MATTKDTLIQYFAGLDVSTLQKLQNYSELLLIPEEDLASNVTMSQMVAKGHQLADVYFPEWTDRGKADFGEFLLEIFALFSEKDFWYVNAHANEGILRKTRSYSNAFSKASTLGYSPDVCKGAFGEFSITFEPGSLITYGRGDLLVTMGSKQFSNDTEFSVETSGVPSTKQLTLREGTQVVEDITFNGCSIYLRRKLIDLDSVSVEIDGLNYSRVRLFGDSSVNSTHYMLLPEEDGSVSVFFGTDGFGVTPPVGKAITVRYRSCSGAESIPVSTCIISDSSPSRQATAAVISGSLTMGKNPSTLTAIKESASLYFSTKGTALNETVLESLLNSLTFVKRSKVSALGGTLSFQVIPISGEAEPSMEELAEIMLLGGLVPVGYALDNLPNSYVNIIDRLGVAVEKLILTVDISRGYSTTSAEAAIRQVLEDVTNPLIKATYGGGFVKSNMDILLRTSVGGIQAISYKVLVDTVESQAPDVSLAPTEIFQTVNQDDVTIRFNVV